VDVSARVTNELSGSSLFADVTEASRFFEKGATGFSATDDPCRFDGLELQTKAWKVEPAVVIAARSSFFDDPRLFPPGTAMLDCALVMRNIPVVWKPLPTLATTRKPLRSDPTTSYNAPHE